MSKKVEAISFKEFIEKYEPEIPSFVIEAVNKLLNKHWNGREAIITQNEIIDAIKVPSEYQEIEANDFRGIIFDNNWLDFEPLYRKKGWSVEYDKPGYCEDYEAYFKFKKGK